MKTALALRHVAFEDLGLIEPLLHGRGFDVNYLEAGVDDLTVELASVDLLVVLGGPIGVEDEECFPWLVEEVALIRQRLDARRPLLGICLGAQLMARALGARVRPTGGKEIGFAPLTLTEAGQNTALVELRDQPMLHWHGDQFDLPAGTESLATTAVCAHQAFAPHDRALGLQFHPEVDPARFEQWLIGHIDELEHAGIAPGELRTAMAREADGLKAALKRLMDRWLDQALL
ncbi:MAG: glutamine amidotransferase [Burkholderiales bacterium]|nr:glutamine amidotransferase [Burkholderiales bacterium]MBW8890961.1 glutamine amidotransferase [Burkholderiales bacterium]